MKRDQPEAAGSEGRTADRHGLNEISFLEVANTLLRHRGLLLILMVASAVCFVTIGFFTPRWYTTDTTFVTQTPGRDRGQLSGVAEQFGLSLPAAGGSESPQFYADLLTSRRLLLETVQTTYEVPLEAADSVRRLDLVEYYEVAGEGRPAREASAIQRLSEHLSVSAQPQTGTVNLQVSTTHPSLSRQVADRMLELVNRFNLETRQTQAAAERRFTEERIKEARLDLQAVEDSLQRFLLRNRQFENSPQLRFEHDRLQRRVTLQQDVVTSLARSLEQAKIDEVRNTPVITVLDPPERPPYSDSRRLLLRGLLGIVFGALVGGFWLLGRAFLNRSREADPDSFEEFRSLLTQTQRDFRRVLPWTGSS